MAASSARSPLATSSTFISSDLEAQAAGDSKSLGESPSPGWCGLRWFRPGPRMISDAIIGLSDGLTVPFALSAGLSAFNNTQVVVLGGLAELVAGAISMGLGGFIGAKSEA